MFIAYMYIRYIANACITLQAANAVSSKCSIDLGLLLTRTIPLLHPLHPLALQVVCNDKHVPPTASLSVCSDARLV
jgi:hypothetical protein